MELKELEKNLKLLRKTGKETIELKIDLVLQLIETIKTLETQLKIQDTKVAIMLVQKTDLVNELKKQGMPIKEIEKILNKAFKNNIEELKDE